MRLHADGFILHYANNIRMEGKSSVYYEVWIMLPKQNQITMADTTDEYVLMIAACLMCKSAEKKQ